MNASKYFEQKLFENSSVTSENFSHVPVLLNEVLEFLNPQKNQTFIDCTVGFGGHSKKITEKIFPGGKLVALDWDARNLEFARENLKDFPVQFLKSNFADLPEIPADGVLFDLGVSAAHFADGARGFSLRIDGPLDMRFSDENSLTAAGIVNSFPREKLAKILREFGEEFRAGKIAGEICAARRREKFKTTLQLANFIEKILPRRGRNHPATKTFQALRIAVNSELENLKIALLRAVKNLKKGGRIAVISFHSLEDRIVKIFFRNLARENSAFKILTKKPVVPTADEVLKNKKSRSAKLRAIEKIS